MPKKIEGTNKFVVYLYNGKMVRGGEAKPKHFVYRQWGRVQKVDENNKPVGESIPFTDYGEMLTAINKVMRKSSMKNLKRHRTWN
jgi:hypothetical protein